MPETEVTANNEVLKDDENKILYLSNLILPPDSKISREDICESTCLGRGGRNARIIKLKLSNVQCKINILHNCKYLNSDIQGVSKVPHGFKLVIKTALIAGGELY